MFALEMAQSVTGCVAMCFCRSDRPIFPLFSLCSTIKRLSELLERSSDSSTSRHVSPVLTAAAWHPALAGWLSRLRGLARRCRSLVELPLISFRTCCLMPRQDLGPRSQCLHGHSTHSCRSSRPRLNSVCACGRTFFLALSFSALPNLCPPSQHDSHGVDLLCQRTNHLHQSEEAMICLFFFALGPMSTVMLETKLCLPVHRIVLSFLRKQVEVIVARGMLEQAGGD